MIIKLGTGGTGWKIYLHQHLQVLKKHLKTFPKDQVFKIRFNDIRVVTREMSTSHVQDTILHLLRVIKDAATLPQKILIAILLFKKNHEIIMCHIYKKFIY